MKMSVIVPVHENLHDLDRCLQALSEGTRRPDEIIIVDDASSSDLTPTANRYGARLVRLSGRPQGPAHARNVGALWASGDILVFIDADVAVHSDTLARMAQHLNHPEIDAVFGSYDDQPAVPTVVSRYKNLLHHYVHQNASPEAKTFWTGCGAVRREVFQALGGFDTSFGRPAIEDIEFGLRMYRAGYRIQLCKEIQATHLKAWTLGSLLRSDIRDRAIPWSRLLLSGSFPSLPDDLNLRKEARLSAILAWVLVASMVCELLWSPAWVYAVASMLGLYGLNRRLYAFFHRHGSPRFWLSAIALHWLYLLYSSAIFGFIALTTKARCLLARIRLPQQKRKSG